MPLFDPQSTISSGGRWVTLGLRQAFLKGYWRVAPDLNRQDYR
jgi:hypothetical protein